MLIKSHHRETEEAPTLADEVSEMMVNPGHFKCEIVTDKWPDRVLVHLPTIPAVGTLMELPTVGKGFAKFRVESVTILPQVVLEQHFVLLRDNAARFGARIRIELKFVEMDPTEFVPN